MRNHTLKLPVSGVVLRVRELTPLEIYCHGLSPWNPLFKPTPKPTRLIGLSEAEWALYAPALEQQEQMSDEEYRQFLSNIYSAICDCVLGEISPEGTLLERCYSTTAQGPGIYHPQALDDDDLVRLYHFIIGKLQCPPGLAEFLDSDQCLGLRFDAAEHQVSLAKLLRVKSPLVAHIIDRAGAELNRKNRREANNGGTQD